MILALLNHSNFVASKLMLKIDRLLAVRNHQNPPVSKFKSKK
jgi:hypothetical protein